MLTKFQQIFRAATALAIVGIAGIAMTQVQAQPVTVIEYYNKALDAYFISGRANEQQQLDALADFQRTGMSFQAVSAGATATAGLTRVCRFYVNSAMPYANTHFYGREEIDCESIRAQNPSGFTWEGYDFALQSSGNGTCPTGTVAIYRSFRPAAAGKTANHRYSASLSSYDANPSAGYTPEQAAFCATAATDVTAPTAASCGTLYYPGVRIDYQSTNDRLATNRWTRVMSATTLIFNGRPVNPVVEQYASGQTVSLMIEDAADHWTDVGVSTQGSSGEIQSYNLPATLQSRQMTAGQFTPIDRYVAFNPTQNFGSPRQTGNITFLTTELITVPTGTYLACRFSSQIASLYPAIGRAENRKTSMWVVPGIGMIASDVEEAVTDDFGPSATSVNTKVRAVSIQRL